VFHPQPDHLASFKASLIKVANPVPPCLIVHGSIEADAERGGVALARPSLVGSAAPCSLVTLSFGSAAPYSLVTLAFGSAAPYSLVTLAFGSAAPYSLVTLAFGSAAPKRRIAIPCGLAARRRRQAGGRTWWSRPTS
jgi:hypothetical protein